MTLQYEVLAGAKARCRPPIPSILCDSSRECDDGEREILELHGRLLSVGSGLYAASPGPTRRSEPAMLKYLYFYEFRITLY